MPFIVLHPHAFTPKTLVLSPCTQYEQGRGWQLKAPAAVGSSSQAQNNIPSSALTLSPASPAFVQPAQQPTAEGLMKSLQVRFVNASDVIALECSL